MVMYWIDYDDLPPSCSFFPLTYRGLVTFIICRSGRLGSYLLSQLWVSRNNRGVSNKKTKTDRHELFVNEWDLNFSNCFIFKGPKAGTFYYPTVKEPHDLFKELYPRGEATHDAIHFRVYNPAYNTGAMVRIQYSIDPTLPYDMRRIRKMPKRQKFDCVYYIDSTRESNMMNFFILCSVVLKDGGEVHMVLKETDFKNLQDLAKSVNLFIKLDEPYSAQYCPGYTPTHIPIKEARLYIFKLDETRKPERGRSSEVNPSVVRSIRHEKALVAPGKQLKELAIIRRETKGTYNCSTLSAISSSSSDSSTLGVNSSSSSASASIRPRSQHGCDRVTLKMCHNKFR